MKMEEYLSGLTKEGLAEAMDTATRQPSLEKHVEYLLSLSDEEKVFFIARGMMYHCLEMEFNMEGDDIWEACAFYDRIINSDVDDSGFGYYK